MDIADSVRQFITGNFYIGKSSSLRNETSLLDAGIVDSTGVLEIVLFIEQRFGIRVADDEMLPDNLDSIGKITTFVARKVGVPESSCL
jgi:acyl carrier protein